MEVSPILISEIEAWLNIHGITELETRIEYFRLLKRMDNFRQDWLSKKREQNNGK